MWKENCKELTGTSGSSASQIAESAGFGTDRTVALRNDGDGEQVNGEGAFPPRVVLDATSWQSPAYGPVTLPAWLLIPTTAQMAFPELSVAQPGPSQIGFEPILLKLLQVVPSNVAAYMNESGT